MPAPDYRKMYHTLMNAAEDAINILINAQRECEELYLAAGDDEKTNNPLTQDAPHDILNAH